ncbi:hypothetical protein [Streptomyces boluensis]|uniref:Secreted protein n=1 Tax=Streptomyces boluensis TaxID=1775135 RepID=A0A964UU58_9ACTN|nr:hypothetical protein [Streptomyces boluensis]NBE55474.1 hypothetical protein [Streptomyces boluensis]
MINNLARNGLTVSSLALALLTAPASTHAATTASTGAASTVAAVAAARHCHVLTEISLNNVVIRVVRCIDDDQPNTPYYHTNIHNYRHDLFPLTETDIAILRDGEGLELHRAAGDYGEHGINTASAWSYNGAQACLETNRVSGGRQIFCTGVAG